MSRAQAQARILELVRQAQRFGYGGLRLSVRELALELGCERRSVLLALDRLEERGEIVVDVSPRARRDGYDIMDWLALQVLLRGWAFFPAASR